MTKDKKINAILLVGFLGSGKTTLLSNLITRNAFAGRRIAVLVNDFGALPVDGALLPKGEHYVSEINTGSIFCVCVKTSLLKSLEYIAKKINPDILLIEATGAAEPTEFSALLQTPFLVDSYAQALTLCVVDALNFPKLVNILPALTSQLELADIVVLNKIDLVGENELEAVENMIRGVNSRAVVVKTLNASLDIKELELLKTPTASAAQSAGGGDLRPCAPEATTKYEFRAKRTLDKIEFYDFLDKYRNIILRGKGVVEFKSGKIYVEVVNGVVSTRSAEGIVIPQAKRGAMSFILRDDVESRRFVDECAKFEW